ARSVCNQLRGVCTPESPLQETLFRSYAKIPNFKNFANRRLRATIKKTKISKKIYLSHVCGRGFF
ncbi:hypothetical protein KC218_20490, partial [Mycobacterium tuberculosis]|nr:hypothetical protein [Mycobacterium tuberculosis]